MLFKPNKIFLLLFLSKFLIFIPLVHAEFRASDHDGFQRPKENRDEPNKATEQEIKKDTSLSVKDKTESKDSIYEDMDGFKRPKKQQ